jgi:PhnB protein
VETKLNPYLNFNGNARQAMAFYQSVFGGKLAISTYKEFNMSQDPSQDNLVMHSQLETDGGISFMAADVPDPARYQPGTNFSLTLNGDNDAELRGYYEKLSAGGTILEPLEVAPWGDAFGMFNDQFGINWMVNISGKQAE